VNQATLAALVIVAWAAVFVGFVIIWTRKP